MKLIGVLSYCSKVLFLATTTLLAYSIMTINIAVDDLAWLNRLVVEETGDDLILKPTSSDTTGLEAPFPANSPLPLFNSMMMQPNLSTNEYALIPWSNRTRGLRRSNGVKVYHNYTIYTEDGVQKTKFTRLEFVTRPEHMFVPSGFTVNYERPAAEVSFGVEHPDQALYRSWRFDSWLGNGPPLIVLHLVGGFCYENANTQVALDTLFRNAIFMWHNAVGNRRGFDLQIAPGAWCPAQGDAEGRSRERDTVVESLSQRSATDDFRYPPPPSLDFKSIMLYPSRGGYLSPFNALHVMVNTATGQGWSPNWLPSAGDVAAVRALYPGFVDADEGGG
ncbi:hypothetical protein EJ08DRAFT_693926 [Tothia fuscella]|uniref:Uncharacterized protein n=1 Tax=Tothia fuscella TaxID=1048955 RepID=A0A9P4NZE3_9PEZI|nr:hypothetical protein EJ08DRAFT_693926 [Tothia fuscella]